MKRTAVPSSCSSSSSPIHFFSPPQPRTTSPNARANRILPQMSATICRCFSAMLHQKLLLVLLFLQHVITGTEGVRVHSVSVPQPAIVGHEAKLECRWDAIDRPFYSVRWYKDDEQFYSFILGNFPEKVDHDLPGVNVALSYSDTKVVTLREVTLRTAGIYKCEVMSDAPYFQTSFASANLSVVDLPDTPEIRGLRQHYRVGDNLNVTCIAANARPKPHIVFELNGIVITPEMGLVRELEVVQGRHLGLLTTSSQLLIRIQGHQVPTLVVKCKAYTGGLDVEKELVVHVDPARTTMLSFFNAANDSSDTSKHRNSSRPTASLSSLSLLVTMAVVTVLTGAIFS